VIAALKGISTQEVATVAYNNTLEMFKPQNPTWKSEIANISQSLYRGQHTETRPA